MTAPLLDGLRVVEFSRLIAAPLCGLTLADWGADVIKVEPPEGDYTRITLPYFAPDDSAYYYMLNRGKRSVALDLRSLIGRRFVERLITGADIVVESLGEAAANLGRTSEEALARNPRLIWCSISGHGAGRGGRWIDPSLQAAMGMMAMTGDPAGPPMRLPVPLIDFMTAMYATQSILAGLLRARDTGLGGFLDCAMIDAAATLTASAGVYALSAGAPLRRLGTQNMWYVPAGNFQASDGRWVQIMAINELHWRALITALGIREWLEDPDYTGNDARVERREVVHGRIAERMRTQPAVHWVQEIGRAGGLCAPINEIEEAWAQPILRERGLLITEDARGPLPFPVPAATFVNAGWPAAPPAPAPALGEHLAEVAEELGFTADELTELTCGAA